MLQQDYIMRIINDMTRGILTLLGRKVRSPYQPDADIPDSVLTYKLPLQEQLRLMIDRLEINQAEDLLFDSIKPGSAEDMELAVWFYSSLNQLPDSLLSAGEFQREEIAQGLTDAAVKFGIDRMLLEQFAPHI